MKLNCLKSCQNETKIEEMHIPDISKMCTKHLWNVFLWIDLSLFKVVCLAEVSPEFVQEKPTVFLFFYV